MYKKVGKKLSVFIILLMLISGLSGCGSTPALSDKYLVGTTYGGTCWGDFYDSLDGTVKICKDGTIEVYMPELESDGQTVKEDVYVETLTLTEEQYRAIESAVRLDKLYHLDPKPSKDILDGYSSYLILYGKSDQVLKECGGYMPQNEKFMEMHDAVTKNLPMDELHEIRNEWIEELREKGEENQ